MINNLIPKSKLVLILIFILFCLLFTLFLIINPFGPKKDDFKSPKPIVTFDVTPLQKTVINQTKEGEIKDLPNLKGVERKSSEVSIYTFKTRDPFHDDKVIFKDGISVFESRLTPSKKYELGYTEISEIESKYGKAEIMLTGSDEFGPHIKTYIYPQLGLAIVGNPFTNEVLRINIFEPLSSPEEYLKLYGEDIKEAKLAPETL